MPGCFSLQQSILLIIVTLLFAGCSYTQQKDRGGETPLKAGGSISFAMVNEKVFLPNCTACHSGNHSPTLTNYQEVKAQLAGIQTQVLELKRMPKRGPLVDEEMAMLKQWITDGAPEFATSPNPVPQPLNPPVNQGGDRPIVKYGELVVKVLKAKCFICHYKNNPDQITDLDDYNNFVGTIGTSFYVSVVTPVMPPAPKGTPEGAPNPNQLTRSEKELLSNWVVDGMQP